MDRTNRPVGRQEHVTSGNGNVEKHGSGLGTGPVGNKEGFGGRPGGHEKPEGDKDAPDRDLSSLLGGATGGNAAQNIGTILGGLESMAQNSGHSQGDLGAGIGGGNGGGGNSGGSSGGLSGGGGNRNPLAKLIPIILVIIVAIVLFSCMRGAFSSTGVSQNSSLLNNYKPYGDYESGSSTVYSSADKEDDTYENTGGTYTQATGDVNTGTLNTSVASGARGKYTQLLGGGKDTVTVMVYMCGTDLESKSGMATSDLTEMTKASISDNVNLLVYTGGCTQWQNSIISNSTNQIYQVKSGGVELKEDNLGSKPMTDPDTLSSFIKWCRQNYEASRYELICWDHGGGTLSGYGYDEKYPNDGSMTIDKIGEALQAADVQFDFIGFDACLMANLSTALTVEPYADYFIASEETEPGYGWYYTDWLTDLSDNTSISTLDLGKVICDTFTSDNASRTRGDSTTLSVVDLAELSSTVPDAFSSFSSSLDAAVSGSNYNSVASARSSCREFAAEEGIDQIDLINFCDNLNTSESNQLASVLRSAVKYNMTSSDMNNSYGMSVYFPYQKLSYVSIVLQMYKNIGMDSNYQKAVRSFASLETGGQISAGGSSSPLDQLLGGYSSSGSDQYSSYGGYSGSNGDYNTLEDLLGSFLGSRSLADGKVLNGLTADNSDWIDTDLIKNQAKQVSQNTFNTQNLKWTDKNGTKVLKLTEDQWNLIQKIELSVFYDDGNGFIDLGLDNLYSFDSDQDLIAKWDGTWMALNGQIVPYYNTSAVSSSNGYTIIGRIPAMLNNEQVNILVKFTADQPDGTVLGARRVYDSDTETQTKARGLIEIKDGDTIQPLCDYYSYDGTYSDSYEFGDPITASGTLTVSNVALTNADSCSATYRLSDIYSNRYWTPEIPQDASFSN
ncbi:MAG: clostripain-related cysteine peptidase [Lachnospiraceae bacterium]|jgi:hypothetical protein|nr:clostripain-related cysteine peptidase [Lachnospiraceae bacterium]MCI1726976.1 clostripain-related cysteine peptidase [Lachnospiraceae bacterium]